MATVQALAQALAMVLAGGGGAAASPRPRSRSRSVRGRRGARSTRGGNRGRRSRSQSSERRGRGAHRERREHDRRGGREGAARRRTTSPVAARAAGAVRLRPLAARAARMRGAGRPAAPRGGGRQRGDGSTTPQPSSPQESLSPIRRRPRGRGSTPVPPPGNVRRPRRALEDRVRSPPAPRRTSAASAAPGTGGAPHAASVATPAADGFEAFPPLPPPYLPPAGDAADVAGDVAGGSTAAVAAAEEAPVATDGPWVEDTTGDWGWGYGQDWERDWHRRERDWTAPDRSAVQHVDEIADEAWGTWGLEPDTSCYAGIDPDDIDRAGMEAPTAPTLAQRKALVVALRRSKARWVTVAADQDGRCGHWNHD